MKSTSGKPSDKEWDFSPLLRKILTTEQRVQQHAAIYYEYARESGSLRKLAAKYSRLPEDAKSEVDERFSLTPLHGGLGPRRVPPALVQLDVIPFWNCILWPEFFPDTPWLDIPQGERRKRIERYMVANPSGPIIEINKLDELNGWRLPKLGQRSISGTVEYLVVAVNWAGGNDSDIAAAFADFLRKSRPKDFPELRGDASRGNVTAAFLTRLAVMRLLNSYNFRDATIIADTLRIKIPIYQSDALKMRQRVRADLHRLFLSETFRQLKKVALLTAAELPIHYDTATARKHRSRI